MSRHNHKVYGLRWATQIPFFHFITWRVPGYCWLLEAISTEHNSAKCTRGQIWQQHNVTLPLTSPLQCQSHSMTMHRNASNRSSWLFEKHHHHDKWRTTIQYTYRSKRRFDLWGHYHRIKTRNKRIERTDCCCWHKIHDKFRADHIFCNPTLVIIQLWCESWVATKEIYEESAAVASWSENVQKNV